MRFLIGVLSLAFGASCSGGVTAEEIDAEIQRVSVCEFEADCELLSGPVGWSCGVPVNRTMTSTLSRMFDEYDVPDDFFLLPPQCPMNAPECPQIGCLADAQGQFRCQRVPDCR